jgi:hypothetical protein
VGEVEVDHSDPIALEVQVPLGEVAVHDDLRKLQQLVLGNKLLASGHRGVGPVSQVGA